jgi:hypothetical protein
MFRQRVIGIARNVIGLPHRFCRNHDETFDVSPRVAVRCLNCDASDSHSGSLRLLLSRSNAGSRVRRSFGAGIDALCVDIGIWFGGESDGRSVEIR